MAFTQAFGLSLPTNPRVDAGFMVATATAPNGPGL
jgi:hypothetical protein